MNDIITYIWKMGLAFTLLIGFYHLVLRKETLHYFKRMYLLIAPWVAIILPFIKLQTKEGQFAYEFAEPLQPIQFQNTIEVIQQSSFDWSVLLYGCIGVVAISLLIHTLFGIRKVYSFINTSKQEKLIVGVLCDSNQSVSPFSFFHYIVLKKNQHSHEELKNIIEHEQVHVYQKHFIDMLQAQLLTIVCWWNPISWLYRHFVVENLEFIVDQEVLRTGVNKKNYQFSILKTSVYDSSMVFANHFNQSLIKKRIQMMNKQLSNPKNLWRTVFLVPLLLLLWIGVGQIKATEPSDASTEYLSIENLDNGVDEAYLKDSIPDDTKIYVNNLEVSKQEMEKINPDNIESVNVLKGEVSDEIRIQLKGNTRTDEDEQDKKSFTMVFDYEENPNGESTITKFNEEDLHIDGPIEIPDDVNVYIDGELVDSKKLDDIPTSEIATMNVVKVGGLEEVRIQLKEKSDELLKVQDDIKIVAKQLEITKNQLETTKQELSLIISEINYIFVDDVEVSRAEFKNKYANTNFPIEYIWRYKVYEDEVAVQFYYTSESTFQNRKPYSYYNNKYGLGLPPAPPPPPAPPVAPESPSSNPPPAPPAPPVAPEGQGEVPQSPVPHLEPIPGHNQTDIKFVFVNDQEISLAEYEKKYKNKKFHLKIDYSSIKLGEEYVRGIFCYKSNAAFENRKPKTYFEEKYGFEFPSLKSNPPSADSGNISLHGYVSSSSND